MRVIHLLLCLLFLTACATQPGKPGTPLPPQNKAVGEKWAPEVRQFIDVMLVAFQDGKSMPRVEKIEEAFGVRAIPYSDAAMVKASGYESQYTLEGWSLNNVSSPVQSAYYSTFKTRNGRLYQIGTFNIDFQHYCINPYDFAVYTGAHFNIADLPPFHGKAPDIPKEYLQPVYIWGMFDRSPSGQYGFFKEGVNGGLRLTSDRRCIESFKM